VPARFFEVGPVEENLFVKVKCTCIICGFVIIGNVSDGIEEKQREHIEKAHPDQFAVLKSAPKKPPTGF